MDEVPVIAAQARTSGSAAGSALLSVAEWSVDRIPVGPGKPGALTLAIQREYMGIAQGTLEDRYGWLTPVPTRQAASTTTRKVRREPVGDMSASAF